MNKKTKDLIFIFVFMGILLSLFIVEIFAFDFLTSKIDQEERNPIFFRDILVKDNYNSTFKLDIKFETDKPEFLVEEKIHIHAILDRIHNNSVYPLSIVYFAFGGRDLVN